MNEGRDSQADFGSQATVISLGDAATIKGGKRLPAGHVLQERANGAPYIRIVDWDSGRISTAALRFVSAKTQSLIDKYRVEKDDIFISIVGTIGRIAQIPSSLNRAFLSENAAKISVDPDKFDPAFLKYFLQSKQGQSEISRHVVGSTQPKLALSRIAQIKVPCPTVDEQRRIAGVLGVLDELIDINERLGRQMEDLLQTKFTEMQFDTAGDAALGELVEINPKYPKPQGVAAYVDMQALPTDSYGLENVRERVAQGGARFMNGDTLLARITPCLENGKAAFVDRLSGAEVGVGSTEFIVMKPRRGLPAQWPYFLARSERFREYAVRQMSGTTGRQRLAAEAVEVYAIARPGWAALEKFGSLAAPFFASMSELNRESEQLRTARDELLPLLISGKVRVRPDEIVGQGAQAGAA